jgi:S1-C subfamily serine protease
MAFEVRTLWRVAALTDLSHEISEIHSRLAASVAQVDGRGGRPASGIVWAPGLVLTADHVLEDEDNIVVTAPPGPFRATILGRDRPTDLALLRVDGIRANPAPRGRSQMLRPGHLVLALGNPGQHQLTFGMVSGFSGVGSWRGGGRVLLMQTTAQLLPGFSGGPLVDSQGQVVGVNSWNFGRGIPLAIGIDAAESVAQSLQEHGRIRRAYLGLGSQRVALPPELQNQLGQQTGLLIVSIESGGPAARSGLLQGDTIVTLKGDKIGELEGLFGALQTLEVGVAYPFGIVRAGELKEITVTPGERP